MLAFLKRNFRWIGGGFLLTFCSSFGQTFFISASAGEWRAAFSLSHGEFGGIYMAATLASAASLPFVGKIVDIAPERRVVLMTMPVLAAACLLAAYAPSVMVLTIAIFLLRLFGQGMMTHIALTATGRWYAAERGRAISLVVLGHQGGEFILPILFSIVALRFGFQAGWIAGAAALLAVGLPLSYLAYRHPRAPRGEAPTGAGATRDWTRAEVLRDPYFWPLMTGVLAPPFIGTVIFFHQDYLTELRGWAPTAFAISLSVMAATTTGMALFAGWLIDRIGSLRILPFFLLPLAGACLVAGLTSAPSGLVAFMVLLGVSYGFSSTLFGALWPEIYGTRHLGSIRSVIVSAMVFATAAGPGATGALIDLGVDLPTQLLGLAAYCIAITAVMALVAARLRAR